MNNLLEQLKQARQAEREAITFVSEMRRTLEETIEYHQLSVAQAKLVEAQNTLAILDEAVRQEALGLYSATGDKHPFDKVSIVINRNLIYQEAEAFNWAGKNAPTMLKLDTKKFEKHARAVLETMPLTFVKVEEVPSVRIAEKL